MKTGKLFGFWVIAAGLLYFLIPLVFPICESTGGMPMRCFWSARAEMGVGAAVIFGGIFYLGTKNTQRRVGLCLMIGVLACLGAAIPLFLIGVCDHHGAPCRTGTLPAWVIASGFLLISAWGNAWRLSRRDDSSGPEAEHA
ncbi:MAG: DUF4418 family protein [Candidatus Accumulibacter sp.]|jgi:fucose permease|nr:DUF4418 family protein [Accumulibacter sp.]